MLTWAKLVCLSCLFNGLMDCLQNITYNSHIFNASEEYHVEHGKNCAFEEELKMGNIILTECVLEKFAEAKGAQAKKVGFKLLSVGYIDKGVPLSMEVWNITAAPSKCTLCA